MTPSHPTPPTLSMRGVLRACPGYRRLWQARLCSLMGDWFNTLALFALLRELNQSTPAVIGMLYILKLAPMFLLGPAAGVLADRFNRANIMIVTDVVRCALVLCYFLVPLFPQQAAPLTLILVGLQASMSAFFEPARMALMPNLVPAHGLVSANALSAATWSVCYAVGTAVGGAANHLLGWRTVIALDACSYLVSAWLIARIGYNHVRVAVAAGGGWQRLLGFSDIAEGFAYLKGHPRTTYMLFFKTGLALAGATEAVFTLLGERIYTWGGRPDLGIGALLAARAIGTGLGPVVGRRLSRDDPGRMHTLMIGAFAFSACCYLVLSTTTLPVFAMLLALGGAFGSGLIWVFSSVILQQLVPDAFRGRVFSAEFGLAMATMSTSIFFFTRYAEIPGVNLMQLPIGLGLLQLFSGTCLFLVGRTRRLRDAFHAPL